MDKNKKQKNYSVWVLPLLCVILSGIFAVLRVTEVVTWSYWIVFLPIIIAFAIPVMLMLTILGILFLIWVIGLLKK